MTTLQNPCYKRSNGFPDAFLFFLANSKFVAEKKDEVTTHKQVSDKIVAQIKMQTQQGVPDPTVIAPQTISTWLTPPSQRKIEIPALDIYSETLKANGGYVSQRFVKIRTILEQGIMIGIGVQDSHGAHASNITGFRIYKCNDLTGKKITRTVRTFQILDSNGKEFSGEKYADKIIEALTHFSWLELSKTGMSRVVLNDMKAEIADSVLGSDVRRLEMIFQQEGRFLLPSLIKAAWTDATLSNKPAIIQFLQSRANTMKEIGSSTFYESLSIAGRHGDEKFLNLMLGQYPPGATKDLALASAFKGALKGRKTDFAIKLLGQISNVHTGRGKYIVFESVIKYFIPAVMEAVITHPSFNKNYLAKDYYGNLYTPLGVALSNLRRAPELREWVIKFIGTHKPDPNLGNTFFHAISTNDSEIYWSFFWNSELDVKQTVYTNTDRIVEFSKTPHSIAVANQNQALADKIAAHPTFSQPVQAFEPAKKKTKYK